MDIPFDSKFKVLLDLIERADLSVKTNKAYLELFQEMSSALYSLKESNARLLANYRSLDSEVKRLRTQYSELLYAIAQLQR